jgi:hypothetical protein
MSGGGGNSTTTTKQDVPEWMRPYYTGALDQANQLQSKGGPQYYPGQQVADLNNLQMGGIQGTAQTAMGPNASTAARDQNINIESGAYLNPNTNPYLAGTLNTADQQVQNQIASQFGANGRNIVGSAPVQSSAMNQLANEIYGGAYQSGMRNMVQASALSPSLDQGSYMPSQMMMGAGGMLQGQNQNVINANMNKYNYQQQLPENMLSWYSGLLNQNGSPFHSGSQTLPTNSNPYMGAAGGAMSGAAMGSSAGPYGTAIGAGIGGLMGYFGGGG